MTIIDTLCTVGLEADQLPGADALLAAMDTASVDRAVLHPSDTGYAWQNEDANTLLASLAGEYSDRFGAAATVNPWRSDAVDVLKRALDDGAVMLSFEPSVQGFMLSGRKLDAVLEWLASGAFARTAVYVHTGHYEHGTPAQLALLADRFKDITFIMGHCGSTDFATDVNTACAVCPNILLESSWGRPPGFVKRLDAVGHDRGLMGSHWPYNDLPFEWSETRRLLAQQHHAAVFGDNVAALIERGRA